MDKLKTFLFALVFALLVIAVLVLRFETSEAGKCLQNPLVYGTKKISEANNGELVCTCSMAGRQGYMVATKDNLTIIQTGQDSSKWGINPNIISDINITTKS
jgi:hypothetical protein